ncbi:hypothetical protein Tc00.1047053507237.150 [Trypanosoma cruzi]|uniref:Uncharacterized protein n=1 Tax=Trypanosoma cruzi (strain CL Brener) TaxID=353153 RepID=Q4DYX8_TRYCC|nr:hypothetical protein Tc00.1047053507237.150 [Trypanosoma cruzi]EAN97727.1 hypothetical protein Tc00.1047053507237.150 [Trypanosoma cruzi]|eukprot:XP_819578.1 hypothetical protein [Trypanosoma cruzi strain CL Brener]
MMNHSGRHAREVHRDGASSRPQPAGECTPTKYMDETPPNTHMPFHAAINRSEGAFWCVGVHSHIFIPTAINGEESGATATKGKTKTSIATLYQRKAGTTQTELLAAPTQAKFTRGKKTNFAPCGNPQHTIQA